MAPTLHEQITGQLREQMEDGTLPPGAPVPSSRALADQWGCSRVTASDALRALARDGLILDRKGLGFFVTDTPVARPAGRRTAGTARVDGALPFKILGRPGYRVPPPHVAATLGIAEGEEALARTRLLHLPGGEPVSVVTAWFARSVAEHCELLHRTAPIPGGTTRHIVARTGLRPVLGRDVTTPAVAADLDADVRTALGLAAEAAVLVVLHIAQTADDTAVVVEEGFTGGGFAERVDEYPMDV
ncbi:GntR family transcriptional regulator [Catenulispora pinisilvae]|uniref:GntR family transcriptional regulator n=1 Tax=Catenulispora pinisilvae TaxID=2705253 RepID=UPI0018922345|nr:GntR family transcriptional regulator [Catenulispora pinisilvae]